MPWARAVINVLLGVALLDFWALSPLEVTALAMAGAGTKTEKEEDDEEANNQRALAAALQAQLSAPQKNA